MIVLTRVIAGLNYSSYYHYEAFTKEVEEDIENNSSPDCWLM